MEKCISQDPGIVSRVEKVEGSLGHAKSLAEENAIRCDHEGRCLGSGNNSCRFEVLSKKNEFSSGNPYRDYDD